MTQNSLVNKTCIPCRGDVPPLSREEVSKLLVGLRNNWVVNNLGHLYKEYRFSSFMNAMIFANQIADLAEQEKHHPHLTITWGMCTVEIWTHKINGLTESDFILATKIDLI